MDNWWPQAQVHFVQQWLIYSVNHPTNMPANIPIMQQLQPQPLSQAW